MYCIALRYIEFENWPSPMEMNINEQQAINALQYVQFIHMYAFVCTAEEYLYSLTWLNMAFLSLFLSNSLENLLNWLSIMIWLFICLTCFSICCLAMLFICWFSSSIHLNGIRNRKLVDFSFISFSYPVLRASVYAYIYVVYFEYRMLRCLFRRWYSSRKTT